MNYTSKLFIVTFLSLFLFSEMIARQPGDRRERRRQQAGQEVAAPVRLTDTTTPLHLLAPDYGFNYGLQDATSIKAVTDRILAYLERVTPAAIAHQNTNIEITDFNDINSSTRFKPGDFRITSYEWGVTYSGMLQMAAATNDTAYLDYVKRRVNLLANSAPYFRRVLDDTGSIDDGIHRMLKPSSLDDSGAMALGMIQTFLVNPNENIRPLIDNYLNYIMYHEFRLPDGTFARNRPQKNSLWLDDMYMSMPAIAFMGKLTGEKRYFDEAVRQALLFKEHMWIPEKNLFRHAWIQGMGEHPSFFWGRANGWAIMALSKVLDVLPPEHEGYNQVMELLRAHIRGLAVLQSGKGLWHQLLDRNDTYLETSASAMFVYVIANAINNGWICKKTYLPVVSLGWAAVAGQINSIGQVEGTCVGTGMAFDPAYYYHRPISVYAAHGYGPVLKAGTEMIKLARDTHIRMNDSAVLFFTNPPQTTEPIFYEVDWDNMPLVAGSSREGDNPVVFLVGDSTMKTGRGVGDDGQWGWGSMFAAFLDTSRISVENHARGGRSSRTFYTEGLWDLVFRGLRAGDYLLVQFGHNDAGSLNTGRARGTLPGVGDESEWVTIEPAGDGRKVFTRKGLPTFFKEIYQPGGREQVFTFGRYMRRYIRQAKARGVKVVVVSPTPVNTWANGRMNRLDQTYAKWSQQVAQEEGVPFIDLNNIAALKYEAKGEAAVKDHFVDKVHTTSKGAVLHARGVAEGVLALESFPLAGYINKEALTRELNVASKPLFRDPVYDGAADPVVIWNEAERRWFMFYTNRRANMEAPRGVDWVHGTKIGIAESLDGGATWSYRGTANINYGDANTTLWAPDVIEHEGTYNMFVTIVPGIYTDWHHPDYIIQRYIIHLTSRNLIDWEYKSRLNLPTNRAIDAEMIRAQDGTWRLFYNNEREGKSIWYAESSDLVNWVDRGRAVSQRGEGPKVFKWQGKYFLLMDIWSGMAVFSSPDMKNWTRQENNILQAPGIGPDDKVIGQHGDVLVSDGRAFLFYFTHPGRRGEGARESTVETRRSTLHVAELELVNGELTTNRDNPVFIDLKP